MAKHKKLGQRNVGVALETADGSIWTGKVYMGRYTPLDVIFDTGSDWLVVESHECSNCDGNTYDTSQSTAVGETFSTRVYGSAYLEGLEYTDTVCVLLNSCVQDFEFFAVYEQTGLKEPLDGVLGLARDNAYYFQNYDGSD